MIFIPGTTVNWSARIHAAATELDRVVLSFCVQGAEVLVKTYTEFEADTEEGWADFAVSLTQAESLRFPNAARIDVQANVMMDDDRSATGVAQILTDRQLHREVMDNG